MSSTHDQQDAEGGNQEIVVDQEVPEEEVQRTLNEPIGDVLQVDKQNGITRMYF